MANKDTDRRVEAYVTSEMRCQSYSNCPVFRNGGCDIGEHALAWSKTLVSSDLRNSDALVQQAIETMPSVLQSRVAAMEAVLRSMTHRQSTCPVWGDIKNFTFHKTFYPGNGQVETSNGSWSVR